jgi:hypothetical protein
MSDKTGLLLVEGSNDKLFFEAFCKKCNLDTEVLVAPPSELTAEYVYDTKQGCIKHLPLQFKRVRNGAITRLGLVLDADQISDGGGFAKTIEQIAATIDPELGFATHPTSLSNGGLIFANNNGLADFGVWIMPNNASEGILEDWLSQTILTEGKVRTLLTHAEQTVAALPNLLDIPAFTPSNHKKAEIATWLAWQKKPGMGLAYTIKEELLDQTTPQYLGLQEWLKRVFQ